MREGNGEERRSLQQRWMDGQEEADRDLRQQLDDYRKWNDARVDKLRIFVAKASVLVATALLVAPLIWNLIKLIRHFLKAP